MKKNKLGIVEGNMHIYPHTEPCADCGKERAWITGGYTNHGAGKQIKECPYCGSKLTPLENNEKRRNTRETKER